MFAGHTPPTEYEQEQYKKACFKGAYPYIIGRFVEAMFVQCNLSPVIIEMAKGIQREMGYAPRWMQAIANASVGISKEAAEVAAVLFCEDYLKEHSL